MDKAGFLTRALWLQQQLQNSLIHCSSVDMQRALYRVQYRISYLSSRIQELNSTADSLIRALCRGSYTHTAAQRAIEACLQIEAYEAAKDALECLCKALSAVK